MCVVLIGVSCLLNVSGANPSLTWSNISGPWSAEFNGSFGAVAVHPSNSNVIFLGNSALGPGVFKSADGGATWVAKNDGIVQLGLFTKNYPPISKIMISPSNPSVIYLGTLVDNPLFEGGVGDIYRSTDGGESWQRASGPANLLGVHELHGSVFDFDVHPLNPDIVYAGVSGQGIMKTIDGGNHWTEVFSGVTHQGAVDYFHIVRIHPSMPETVFFSGFTYYAADVLPVPTRQFDTTGTPGLIPFPLRKSTDAGATWNNTGTPSSMALHSDLQFEPASGLMYLSTIAYQTPVFIYIKNRGIFKSADTGASWQSINSSSVGDLSALPFVALMANPSSVNGGVFASGGLSGQLLATTDRGSHWMTVGPCLLNTYVGRAVLAGNKLILLTSLGIYSADASALFAPAPPVVSSFNPAIMTGLPLPQTQPVTITGSGFTSSSRLTFSDGTTTFSDRVPTFVSTTELRYNIAVGPNAGTWTVKVANGTVESLPRTFYVLSSAAQLTGLSISGPSVITENGTGQFAATALFSDGSSQSVTPTWNENSSVTTISSSGLLSAGSVSADTVVTVTASYVSAGITKTTSADVIIANAGSGSGSQTIHALVNGNFEAGSSPWAPTGDADVYAGSYPHAGSYYAYLGNANNAGGAVAQFFPIPAGTTAATLRFYLNIVTEETSTTGAYDKMKIDLATANDEYVGTIAEFSNLDKGANVNGTYSVKTFDIMPLLNAHKGESLFLIFAGETDSTLKTIFRIDDVDLKLTVDNPVSLTGLNIRGPSSIREGLGAMFLADAILSDGTSQTISPDMWTENSPATSITEDGFLFTSQVSSDTAVTVTASYTFDGVSRQMAKIVTIIDTNAPRAFRFLSIGGPTAVAENSSGHFWAQAIFDDGTVQDVTPTWSVNGTTSSISSSGLLSTGEVNTDTTVTVSSSCTIGGVTKTASQAVQILNTLPPPTLSHLIISGPSSVTENTTAQYGATAYLTDGSWQTATATWSVDSAASNISGSGSLNAGNVTSNAQATVFANCTLGGITRSASKIVTIINTNLVPAYTLTVIVTNGTVARSPDKAFYTNGAIITLTATPPANLAFLGWGGSFTSYSNPVTLTICSNTVLTASFGVPEIRISPPTFSADGKVHTRIFGSPGVAFEIQTSTNMNTWEMATTGQIPASGTIQIEVVGNARERARFYRAMVPTGP
jgi:hypothetical protein